eukprot:jgi/Ulvmu1/7923/UM004_0155.1
MAGGKNKAKGPSNSARAAAFLNKNAGSIISPGLGGSAAPGFGFGAALTPESALSQVDPEIAQCLKHVTKRDENTKIKALQLLHTKFSVLEGESAADLVPAWLFAYKRVSLDNARTVRLAGARALSRIVQQAGRKLAPHLRELMGCWWLAMHDTYAEARQEAWIAFEACFATAQKRRQAIVHSRTALVAHLRDTLFASAEDLGEPTKESKEELEERQQRACTQALLAFTGMAELFPTTMPSSSFSVRDTTSSRNGPADPLTHSSASSAPASSNASASETSPATAEERESILKALIPVWQDAAFWRRGLQADRPTVYNAACHLVSHFVQLHSDTAQHLQPMLAPLVFDSLRSAPEVCQNAAWSMILRFTAACPGGLTVSAVSQSLPKQISSSLKTGSTSGAFASGLTPLSLQMLRHGPAEWAEGALSGLWLPAALTGFSNAPAAAQNRAAEVLAGLLLVMVSTAHQTKTSGSDLATSVIREAIASSKAGTFVRALWQVLGSHVTSAESRFQPAATAILESYSGIAQDQLAGQAAPVPELIATQVALLAELSSAATAPAHASQLTRAVMLLPLVHALHTQALQAPLLPQQAQTLHKLLCSCGSDFGSPDGGSTDLVDVAVTRVMAVEGLQAPGGAPQEPKAASDLLTISALLQCGAVSLAAVLDAALHHTLPSAADAVMRDLLAPGHNLNSFRAVCNPLVAQLGPGAARQLSIFVQLVAHSSSDPGRLVATSPSSNVGEGIMLLMLGDALLPEGSAEGATLLRSPAASALRRLGQPGDAAGLLHMLSVLFSEAASAAGAVAEDSIKDAAHVLTRATGLLPCAVHCCRACIEAPNAQHDETSVKHCESVICAIFELAIPHVVGYADADSAAAGTLALQKVAAATWAQLVQPLNAAAATLSPSLPAELMRRLVLWYTRRTATGVAAAQRAPGVAGDGEETGSEAPRELKQLCDLAGATAATALSVLDVACSHSGEAAAEQSVAVLMTAPGAAAAVAETAAEACCSTASTLQDSMPHAQLLLAASVLLRSTQQRALAAWRCYVPWVALMASLADECPAALRRGLTSYLLAAASCGAAAATQVVQQLLRLSLAADASAESALEALDALLEHSSPALTRAAAATFANSRSDLPRRVLNTAEAQSAVAVRAVSALAPHVYAHARAGDAETAAARDEVAAELLAGLRKSSPLLTLNPGPEGAEEATAAGIAASMRCVAQLYVPTVEHQSRQALDEASITLLSALAGSAVPPLDDTAGAKADDTATLAGEDGSSGAVALDAPGDGRHAAAHAALVHGGASEQVRGAFVAAVAHQLRPARAVVMAASMPADAAGSLGRLLLAAATVAHSEAAISGDQERLQGLVEAWLSTATVAVEAHTEDVCEALVAASRRLAAGDAGDAAHDTRSAQQSIGVVMQLGWVQPRQAAALLADVDQAAGAERPLDAASLPSVQLFMQLRELSKGGTTGGADRAIPAVVPRIERLLLRLLLCAGTCMHVARVLQAPAATAQRWLPGSAAFWQRVAQAVLVHVENASVEQAVEEFTMWSGELGVPAMHAALGLVQYKETSAAMHAAGALIALAPSLLINAAEIENGGDGDAEAEPERDTATMLVTAGVDAALAQALAGCKHLNVADCDAPLLVWSVMLARIEGVTNEARRRLAMAFAACDPPVVPCVLDLIVLLLPSADSAGESADESQSRWGIAGHVRETLGASQLASPWHARESARLSTLDVSALSVGIFRSLLRQVPAALRSWFSMLKDAQLAAAVEEYTRVRESPPLLRQEVEAAALVHCEGMAITASGTSREIVASMEVDDGVMLELAIRLPPCYPLQPAEVMLRKKVAIQERSLRRWMLSIAAYLRSQNCSLADAVLLWKSNVDQEFAGVEPCMICYSVVNPSDRSLPKMACKTCSQIFHSVCLYKWFKSRSKSICPHCQCPW